MALLKDTGWNEAVHARDVNMPGIYANEPSAAPPHSPPMRDPWIPYHAPFAERRSGPPYRAYDDNPPTESATSQPPIPQTRTRQYSREKRRASNIPDLTPIELNRQGQEEEAKATRSEVRFTLPYASGAAETTGEAQSSSVDPQVSTAEVDEELRKARQKLRQLQERKEKAEKDKDTLTAADITFYAIPDLKMQIEKLSIQRKDQIKKQKREQRAAPKPQDRKVKGSHHPNVETESENSDDGDGGLEEVD